MYSIGGFTVAGAMLEAATNKTFEQLMTEVMREVEECIVRLPNLLPLLVGYKSL